MKSFKTGERIEASGIYEVTHGEHRLPHEVTLLCNEIFPPCSKCKNRVKFKLLRPVNVDWGKIVLNEIPPLMDETQSLEEEESEQAC
jgi:hypothetical protein